MVACYFCDESLVIAGYEGTTLEAQNHNKTDTEKTMAQRPGTPTENRQIRIASALYARVITRAKEDGVSITRVINEALKDYLAEADHAESLDQLEARIAATLMRASKDTRQLRNDMQINMAIMDTFMRLYLLHTPPLSVEALGAAEADAARRYAKVQQATVEALRDGATLQSVIAQAWDA